MFSKQIARLFKSAAFLVFFSIFGLLGACAWQPPKPVVDYNPDYQFQDIHSFAFVDERSVSADSLMRERVQSAITAEFQGRGLQLVAETEADILVRFMVSTADKQRIHTYDHFYGGAYRCWRCGYPGYATEVQVVDYTEGTLILDIVDPAQKRAIWRAVSKGRVASNLSPTERTERIQTVVNRMLVEFPPQ